MRLHGGPDALGVPLHDFSTNSNACGPCPSALLSVQQTDATRYPDASYTALREQLAHWHGVARERVLLAGSASEFIFRISAAVAQQGDLGGRTVWLPPHSYGDYTHAAQAWGLTPTMQAHEASLRWCCDPSSPLGAPQPELARLCEPSPSNGLLTGPPSVVVLDRAYEPLRLEGTVAVSPEALQQVWQLWSPNKALGLTGVRAAYVIAPRHSESMVATLERLSPSWPLGAQGVALLEAWVQPEVQGWLAQSLHTLREWKTMQTAMLNALGWICLPSVANFFCARPDRAGVPLQHALAELRVQGIKLRDTTSFGLPDFVRLGVLSPLAQDALVQTWKRVSIGMHSSSEGAWA
jgi:histidinol-phosphate aminotransferase